MRITYYVVQPFVEGKRGLLAEQAVSAASKEGALSVGRRLAEHKAGVIVFSRSGDPDFGDFDDAEILAVHGRVPTEVE